MGAQKDTEPHGLRIVRVEWLDATGGTRIGWRPLKALLEPPEEAVSVGFLLREDDVIILVPHISGPEGDGEIAIPTAWVKSIVDLEPVKKKKSPTLSGSGTERTPAQAGSRLSTKRTTASTPDSTG